MFTSLRTRLLASYTFILILTLVVIGVALILVLGARPVSSDEVSVRLANELQIVRSRKDFVLPADGPTHNQEITLNRLSAPLRVGRQLLQTRVLVTDSKGIVSYDSQRTLKGSKPDIQPTPYTIPETAADGTYLPMIHGTLVDSSDPAWLVIGAAPDPATPNAALLLLAVRIPHQLGISEVVQYYGDEILRPLLEAGLLGLLVAFVLALIISRSVTSALQSVAETAAEVGIGKLDQRVKVTGPREVRTVAEAFNRMIDEVDTTQRAQRDFLANVTHDLRTPLTSIQGFSQAIIDGVAIDPSVAQRAAHIIYDEAGRLNRMVQELLDLARVEAGRFTMTRHNVRLQELLQALGERLTPKAAEKGLTLIVDIPILPTIAGDGDRLVQVYTNLVDNAIKHTPSGGTISLLAAPRDGGVLTQVRDTGEGIPTEDLPRVFDRFFQVDKSRQSTQRDGAGLGLTITKQIVEAHGGRIWVESVEGAGTVFSVWFPTLAHDSTTIIRRRPASKPPAPRPVADRESIPGR